MFVWGAMVLSGSAVPRKHRAQNGLALHCADEASEAHIQPAAAVMSDKGVSEVFQLQELRAAEASCHRTKRGLEQALELGRELCVLTQAGGSFSSILTWAFRFLYTNSISFSASFPQISTTGQVSPRGCCSYGRTRVQGQLCPESLPPPVR